MSGVLFIVWIPCEKYEEAISGNRNWNATAAKEIHSGRKHGDHIASSSDSSPELKDSIHGSQDTFAISIESDSLNRVVDKDGVTDKRRQLNRTKSEDALIDKEQTSDDHSREKMLGSMDSDSFRRIMKEKALIKENEEAIDKFFNSSAQKTPLIDNNCSMERIMRGIIDKMKIRNASWVRTNRGNSYQVTFSLESGNRCDDTIHLLSEFGIGQKDYSTIAIVPCTLYHETHTKKAVEDDEERRSTQSIAKETAWNKFIGSVRSRLTVAKIVEEVKADASITFDFVVLVIVASVLAAFGLVENSTLFLAASMLISPLMGPILAATFGAVIKDQKLQYMGLKNEIIGIFLSIAVGFFFGLVVGGFDARYGNGQGLSQEMLSRCELHSLVVGIFIALPSGAAVAIAILGENIGSLVGVAISASLLPPAVNTGLMWSLSCIHTIFKGKGPRFDSFLTTRKYSDNESIELLALGGISLCVTLTNVLCIYVMGFIFLKIKEVAPVVSADQRQFWKHDIKVARDYNKTVNAEEGQKLKEEIGKFREHESENFKGVGAELLRGYPHHTWSPLSIRHHHNHHRKDTVTARASLHDLEALYVSTLSGKSATDKHHRHVGLGSNFPHDILSPINDQYKHTDHISFIAPKHSSEPHCSSAPLDKITELTGNTEQQKTVVTIEPQPGPSSAMTKKQKQKFTVTPVID